MGLQEEMGQGPGVSPIPVRSAFLIVDANACCE